MSSKVCSLAKNRLFVRLSAILVSLTLAFGSLGFIAWAKQDQNTDRETQGQKESVTGITTEVKRESKGSLSEEDLRQVSLLGSHLLNQIDDARKALDGSDEKRAATAVRKGIEVAAIIRRILPVAEEITVVKDRDGTVLYEDRREVQNDQLPLYQVLSKINFLEPITKAKEEAADVEGVRLADTALLQTSLLLDLGFVERRLREAERFLPADPAKANSSLAKAQTEGVNFKLRREEQPLAEVRDALWYAQRAASSGNYVAAKENLAVARRFVKLYHDLLPEEHRTKVNELQGEITELEKKIAETKPEAQQKTVDQLRAMFDKVLPWFAPWPAQAQAQSPAQSADKTAETKTAASKPTKEAGKTESKKPAETKKAANGKE